MSIWKSPIKNAGKWVYYNRVLSSETRHGGINARVLRVQQWLRSVDDFPGWGSVSLSVLIQLVGRHERHSAPSLLKRVPTKRERTGKSRCTWNTAVKTELALVVMGFLTPSRESGEATQKVHQQKFNLIVVGVVECIHESYVFSRSVATSSAECNRCSPRPTWTAGDLRHSTAIFTVMVQWLESRCPNWMGLCQLADQDPTFGLGLLMACLVPSLSCCQ